MQRLPRRFVRAACHPAGEHGRYALRVAAARCGAARAGGMPRSDAPLRRCRSGKFYRFILRVGLVRTGGGPRGFGAALPPTSCISLDVILFGGTWFGGGRARDALDACHAAQYRELYLPERCLPTKRPLPPPVCTSTAHYPTPLYDLFFSHTRLVALGRRGLLHAWCLDCLRVLLPRIYLPFCLPSYLPTSTSRQLRAFAFACL